MWVHEGQDLLDLISFYDLVTRLVDEGKAVDVGYLDFSKAFDTVSNWQPVALASTLFAG